MSRIIVLHTDKPGIREGAELSLSYGVPLYVMQMHKNNPEENQREISELEHLITQIHPRATKIAVTGNNWLSLFLTLEEKLSSFNIDERKNKYITITNNNNATITSYLAKQILDEKKYDLVIRISKTPTKLADRGVNFIRKLGFQLDKLTQPLLGYDLREGNAEEWRRYNNACNPHLNKDYLSGRKFSFYRMISKLFDKTR